jgi:hypothetical protein
MSLPTEGETFSKLIEYIRKAQETSATLAHLTRANDHAAASKGWLAVSEQLKTMQHIIIEIAKGKYH